MKARELYKDCLYARECLRDAVNQGNLNQARLFWFAALAMVRSIGDVVKNVDANGRSQFEAELVTRWKLWKAEPMFADFIKPERDAIVHEYESSLAEEGNLFPKDGGSLLLENGNALPRDTTITRLVKSGGMFEGSAPEVALSEALAWWEEKLSELEQLP
jgi:hypothetical protein